MKDEKAKKKKRRGQMKDVSFFTNVASFQLSAELKIPIVSHEFILLKNPFLAPIFKGLMWPSGVAFPLLSLFLSYLFFWVY